MLSLEGAAPADQSTGAEPDYELLLVVVVVVLVVFTFA
jgi:hypothetical protein